MAKPRCRSDSSVLNHYTTFKKKFLALFPRLISILPIHSRQLVPDKSQCWLPAGLPRPLHKACNSSPKCLLSFTFLFLQFTVFYLEWLLGFHNVKITKSRLFICKTGQGNTNCLAYLHYAWILLQQHHRSVDKLSVNLEKGKWMAADLLKHWKILYK